MASGRQLTRLRDRSLAITLLWGCLAGVVPAHPSPVGGGDVTFDVPRSSSEAAVVATTSTSTSSSTSHHSATTSSSTSTTTIPPLCGTAPTNGCRRGLPFRSSLQLKHDPSDDTKDQLKWKWNRGAATSVSDFADPVNGSATYRVCLYDGSVQPQPLKQLDVLPGGVCGATACWKVFGSASAPKGFKYRNRAAARPYGISDVTLQAGTAGKAKLQVKGNGSNLTLPPLGLALPVTMQLVIEDGATRLCWQTAFGTSQLNTPMLFKAKGPAAVCGAFVTKWGTEGSGEGEFFQSPYGVAVDADGSVFVADNGNARVQKFTSTGDFISQWGSGGSADGQFSQPVGIAVDGAGTVFVADSANNRIQKFTNDGTFVSKWGGLGTGDGQFRNPWDVAVDASGNVFVVDMTNSRIEKFTNAGVFVTKWGSFGSGDGQLNQPSGVAVDGTGNVFVSDTNNARIQKFANDGTFLTKWGSMGTGDGQFSSSGPRGIAVDDGGRVFVTDVNNDRIEVFTNGGSFVAKWGGSGTGDGQFAGVGSSRVDLQACKLEYSIVSPK